MKKPPVQRQMEILEQLRQGVVVSPTKLAEQFGVSAMTIHRDLKQLDAAGRLSKQHGAAVMTQPVTFSNNLRKKSSMNAGAKSAIGRFAAKTLVDPQTDSLIIDSGSTTLAFVNALADTPMHVMVNSLPALSVLAEHRHTQVYSLGGKLNQDIMAFEGSIAFDMLNTCHFTKAFIGTDGIDLKAGFSTTHTANAQLTRLMAKQAKEVYILADLSKFHQRALASIMDFDGITGIVTECGVSEAFRHCFKQHHIQLFEVTPDD